MPLMELGEEEDLRYQELHEKKLRNRFLNHPHPQDPDHLYIDEDMEEFNE